MSDKNAAAEFENKIIRRLSDNGWINSAQIVSLSGDNHKAVISWTPLGIERMRGLYAALCDAGLIDSFYGGEMMALRSLCRFCIQEHGQANLGNSETDPRQ